MSEEYVETTFDKFIRWIKYDAKHLHRDVIYGVKNLIKWFPTIWKDRDYDHFYIYEVLRVKLENQAVYISQKNRYTRAQRDAELMMLISRLITIQQEDLYDMEYMEYHESEFNFLDVTDEDSIPEKYKDSKRLEINLISERFDEYFERYPRQYKKAVSGELNLFRRSEDESENKKIYAMEIAHENQKRSRKLLFKLLDENIERFWD
jgi:hypothetical protein